MNLPFSIEEFLKVFKEYNLHVYPFQFVLNLLAVLCIIFILKKSEHNGKFILFVLSFFWMWMGIVYHLIFFTAINKAAYLFGSLFVLQGILFLLLAIKKKIIVKFQWNTYGVTAMLLLFFSLIIYPTLGYMQHHFYPSAPTFGLPCPTTIFTFGILLMISNTIPFYIIIIPIIWSLIGSVAAFTLGMREDFSLLASAFLTAYLFVIKQRNIKGASVNRIF